MTSTFHWKNSRSLPFWGFSARHNLGVLNHLTGLGSELIFALTIRASDGVISGRIASCLPPRSSKLKSCSAISWPLFAVKRSRYSKIGESYSSKPLRSETRRHASTIQFRSRMSSG